MALILPDDLLSAWEQQTEYFPFFKNEEDFMEQGNLVNAF